VTPLRYIGIRCDAFGQMATDLTTYRVFIASPSGLEDERKSFRESIEEFNRMDSMHRGLQFVPVGWEDTLETAGRPQELINADIRTSDYFVLVIWDRWGSSPTKKPGRFTSGTEEEYDVAKQALHDTHFPLKQIIILFKGVGARQLCDPGVQLQRVLKFRRKVEEDKEFIFHLFDSPREFERILRRFLAKWTRDQEQHCEDGKSGATNEPTPSPQTPAAPDKSDEKTYTVDDEIALARKALLTNSRKAIIEYALLLIWFGRLSRARRALERAVTTVEGPSDRSTRPALESAIETVSASLQRSEQIVAVEDALSGTTSSKALYIQRYITQIDPYDEYLREELDPRLNASDAAASSPLDDKGATEALRSIASLTDTLQQIGCDLRKFGLLGLSEEVFQQCLALARSTKSAIQVVQLLTDLCIVSSQKRDYYSARSLARLAVSATPARMAHLRAIVRSNLGQVLITVEEYVEAKELLEEAHMYWRDFIREHVDFSREQKSANGVGFFEVQQERGQRYWSFQDHSAAAHAGLGLIHLHKGEHELAEKYHVEAHLEVGHASAVSPMIENNLGVIYQIMGNIPEALYYYGFARGADLGLMVEAQMTHNRVAATSCQGSKENKDIGLITQGRALLALVSRFATAKTTDPTPEI